MLSHEHCVGSVEGAMYCCYEDVNEHMREKLLKLFLVWKTWCSFMDKVGLNSCCALTHLFRVRC